MGSRVVMNAMNSFFASVKQSYNPELKGKTVVVTGSQQRTIAKSPDAEY